MDHSRFESQNITIKDLLGFVKEGWKLMVIGVILGGLAGLVISSLLKPEYESTAEFSFSFDYSRTGLLTDIEEDQAMEVAGDVVNSTEVRQRIIERVNELGIQITPDQLKSDFIAERRFGQWLLKVRRGDPSEAARFSNIWGEAARTSLINAQQAAVKADALHRYVLSLESCFQQSTSGQVAQPLCQASSRLELQDEMDASGKDLAKWQEQSLGFFPGLNFLWAQEAVENNAPIQHSRGSMILFGCMAGFLISVIISLIVIKI
jgi:uncharacterized protein involved in exopolysaccharide biosynthesis